MHLDPLVIRSGFSHLSSGDSALRSAQDSIIAEILQLFEDANCSGLGWRQIASLYLGDPSQQCPSPWTETAIPARSCSARAQNSNSSCLGVNIPVSEVYDRVCGRIVGYTTRTGILSAFNDSNDIDSSYVDGVSVTYGLPRQHIWSFGGGRGMCQCDNGSHVPPLFVGESYFCDSQDNGPLWDGQDCMTACCTFNSPPWFTVTLPANTTDDIEVRLCSHENPGISIRLLELYVK